MITITHLDPPGAMVIDSGSENLDELLEKLRERAAWLGKDILVEVKMNSRTWCGWIPFSSEYPIELVRESWALWLEGAE